MLNKLTEYLGKLKPQYDDDSIDRLNYIYTNLVILSFAITIGGWEQYVENYCFVENTYWVKMEDRLPDDHGERERREIQYYQWVPFVLALQALLFYLPRLIWNMLNWQSGMNITALIQSAFATKKEGDKLVLKGKDDAATGISIVATHLKDAIDYHKDFGISKTRKVPLVTTFNKGIGVYLTCLYIFVKVLFIVNVVSQFLILNRFLGPQYNLWGLDILRDLINGVEWETSGHFPRVTMCDFEVRRLGNLQRFSVQCVLMINMFNEKLYLFLWWWFLLVAILTVLNFFYWTVISFVPKFRVDFVKRYLKVKDRLRGGRGDVDTFVRKVLRPDGVLVLRLISDNAGDIVCSNVVAAVWDKVYPPEKDALRSMDEGFTEKPPTGATE